MNLMSFVCLFFNHHLKTFNWPSFYNRHLGALYLMVAYTKQNQWIWEVLHLDEIHVM